MSFLNLSGFLVGAGLVVLAGGLYLLQRLRIRHREVVVPTTLFWHAAVQETRARVLVRRFRHPLAYVLLLAIASLLWLALAEPAPRADEDQRAVVFLLDGSAGMAWGDRFERAKATLEDQVARLGDRGADVILCGGWPRTLLRRGEHPILLRERLAGLAPEACPSTLEQVAAALPRDRATRLVVVGDAPLRASAIPDDWELLRPGASGRRPANGGVLALGVSEAASGAWDRVDVHIDAVPGYTVNLPALRDVPARGQEVVVRAPGGDAIALDDEARIRLPVRSRIRVRAVPELRAVFEADPGVEIADDGVVLELTDGAELVMEGPAESLEGAPGALFELVDVTDERTTPALVLRVGPERRVRIGRDLLTDRTNFVHSRAYPLFVAQAVRWLAGAESFPAFVAAGERIPGTGFAPPVAGSYGALHASLLDPLAVSDARRDDGIEGMAGGVDLAAWLALLAFVLLLGEWFFHRTGRVP